MDGGVGMRGEGRTRGSPFIGAEGARRRRLGGEVGGGDFGFRRNGREGRGNDQERARRD